MNWIFLTHDKQSSTSLASTKQETFFRDTMCALFRDLARKLSCVALRGRVVYLAGNIWWSDHEDSTDYDDHHVGGICTDDDDDDDDDEDIDQSCRFGHRRNVLQTA